MKYLVILSLIFFSFEKEEDIPCYKPFEVNDLKECLAKDIGNKYHTCCGVI